MIKVYSTDNIAIAGHVHSILEANGISCFIKNINLSGAFGELPFNECWPEIWLHNEQDYDFANQLLKNILSEAIEAEPWFCLCGEEIDGVFNQCWSCGYYHNNNESI